MLIKTNRLYFNHKKIQIKALGLKNNLKWHWFSEKAKKWYFLSLQVTFLSLLPKSDITSFVTSRYHITANGMPDHRWLELPRNQSHIKPSTTSKLWSIFLQKGCLRSEATHRPKSLKIHCPKFWKHKFHKNSGLQQLWRSENRRWRFLDR